MLNILDYTLHIANDLESRLKIYRLLFNEYNKKGYVSEDNVNLWYTKFNLYPNTLTLYVEKDNRILNTVTIISQSEYGLPSNEIFNNELETLRNKDNKLVEIISLANFDKNEKQAFELLILITLEISFSCFKAAYTIATINPRHVGYYKKYLHFKNLGVLKVFAKVNNAMADLIFLNKQTFTEKIELTRLFINVFNSSQHFNEVKLSLRNYIQHEHKPLNSLDFEYLVNLLRHGEHDESEIINQHTLNLPPIHQSHRQLDRTCVV